jgi:hypothetical protein
MSFDGFYRVLCRNGHLHHEDCGCCGFGESCFEQAVIDSWTDDEFFSPPTLWKCLDCGEVAGWWELIDQTNGYDPESETELEEVTPVEHQTCNLGHLHQVKAATYKPKVKRGHIVNGGLK